MCLNSAVLIPHARQGAQPPMAFTDSKRKQASSDYLLPSGHVEGAEALEMEPMTQFCCVTLSLPAPVA